MKKIIIEVLKRIVLAICLLYVFNAIGGGLNIFIPINYITVFIISILGISGLLSLIAVYFVLL